MFKNIAISFLILITAVLAFLLLQNLPDAKKWRKEEAENEKARIDAENDPEWQETIRRVRARRAPNLANNYLNSLENGDIQNV